MPAKTVKIACAGSNLAPLSALNPFQGNLKFLSDDNYEKLKRQILDLGFSEPISVWDCGGVFHVLNGHQRLAALIRMGEDGIELPAEFPINRVDAKNKAEAKRKVLSLTSQFGEMTEGGLADFLREAEIELSEAAESFRFPEIDAEFFNLPDFEPVGIETQGRLDELKKAKCPECGHEFRP